MNRSLRVIAAALFGLSLSLGTAAAHASTTFPEALRKKLGLTEIAGPPPGCRLCHQDDLGGLKTATKPLGRSLLAAGAMGASVPSLLAALSTLESDGTDSDHDGTPDISELKAGEDPNVAKSIDGMPPASVEEIPLPETGCTLSRSPLAPRPSLFAAVALAGSLLALCRRRRRSA